MASRAEYTSFEVDGRWFGGIRERGRGGGGKGAQRSGFKAASVKAL